MQGTTSSQKAPRQFLLALTQNWNDQRLNIETKVLYTSRFHCIVLATFVNVMSQQIYRFFIFCSSSSCGAQWYGKPRWPQSGHGLPQ